MRPSSRLKDIAQALTKWTPQDAPAMTWLLPELRDVLDASFVGAYRPLATDQGWSLEFMYGAGETAASQVRAFERWVGQLQGSNRFLAYNPYSVDLQQRNRALLRSELARSVVAELNEALYQAVGLPGSDQVRVLVCEGPRLLSWLGATREEPFTRRDAGVLRYLTRPVEERLRLERLLQPRWPSTLAMEAALEAVGRPAFVVGPKNTIDFGNKLGSALLARDPKGVLASIRQSARKASDGAFSITPLTVLGAPPYLLAIQKEQRHGLASLVSLAQRRWGLTARQTHVLELMLTGATNKDIAHQSSCAEVTVEKHITELYRRSGSRSRADLARRLFFGGLHA
jgi:DNA-binding CsgD family transcriptional regulator